MASMVVRAAAAARLPSLRPRRNGSGVLTGLRIGTGHYGVRLALSSSAASPKEFEVACLPVDDSSLGPGEDYVSDLRMAYEEELDHFYRVLAIKTDMLFRAYPEHKPFAVSEEDKAVQERLKEFANECIDLLDDALRRIPAEKRRPLFSVFGNVYQVFASVKWYAEGGCAQWWMALQITEELEIMRKMVSSACGGTPLDRETVFDRKEALTGVDVQAALRGHGVGSNLSLVIFELIDAIYSNVKSDIDDMVFDFTA